MSGQSAPHQPHCSGGHRRMAIESARLNRVLAYYTWAGQTGFSKGNIRVMPSKGNPLSSELACTRHGRTRDFGPDFCSPEFTSLDNTCINVKPHVRDAYRHGEVLSPWQVTVWWKSHDVIATQSLVFRPRKRTPFTSPFLWMLLKGTLNIQITCMISE